MLRTFTAHESLDPVTNIQLEPEVDFLLRRSHRELAGWDDSQLHAGAVGELDRHAEVLRPGFLMSASLRGVEGDNRGRWCVGRPAVPARPCHGLRITGGLVGVGRSLLPPEQMRYPGELHH